MKKLPHLLSLLLLLGLITSGTTQSNPEGQPEDENLSKRPFIHYMHETVLPFLQTEQSNLFSQLSEADAARLNEIRNQMESARQQSLENRKAPAKLRAKTKQKPGRPAAKRNSGLAQMARDSNRIITMEIISETRSILSQYEQAVKSSMESIRNEKKTWITDLKSLAAEQKDDSSRTARLKRGKGSVLPAVTPISLVLWNGESLNQISMLTKTMHRIQVREIKSTPEFQAYRKEVMQYAAANIIPVLKEQREQWNELLNEEDMKKIERARRLLLDSRKAKGSKQIRPTASVTGKMNKESRFSDGPGHEWSDSLERPLHGQRNFANLPPGEWRDSMRIRMHENSDSMGFMGKNGPGNRPGIHQRQGKRDDQLQKRARLLVWSVIKDHKSDFETFKAEMQPHHETWKADLQGIAVSWFPEVNPHLMDRITRELIKRRVNAFGDPVAFLLWDPNREKPEKPDLRPLMKDIRNYSRTDMLPVLLPMRAEFDELLSEGEKAKITRAKRLQAQKRLLLKKRKNGEQVEKSEYLALKRRTNNNQKALNTILVNHRQDIRKILGELVEEKEGWHADIRAMAQPYIRDVKLEPRVKREMYQRIMTTAMRPARPMGFLMLNPELNPDLIGANENEPENEAVDENGESTVLDLKVAQGAEGLEDENTEDQDNAFKMATEVQDMYAQNEYVRVYPSPAKSLLFVDLNLQESSLVNVELYNINGKLCKSLVNKHCRAGEHKLTMDVNAVQNGYYILKVQFGNHHSYNKKVLIE